MYSNAKNTANYLAKSKTLLNIALPKPRIASYISTYSLIWAYSPLHFCARSCEVLANLRGVRSLFVHTKLVFNKCQNLTRVAIPRTTVTGLHLLHLLISYQSHSLSNSSMVTLPNLSRRKDYTVAPYPCSASGAMTSLKAHMPQCTI